MIKDLRTYFLELMDLMVVNTPLKPTLKHPDISKPSKKGIFLSKLMMLL